MNYHASAPRVESIGKSLFAGFSTRAGMLEELVDTNFLRWQNTRIPQACTANFSSSSSNLPTPMNKAELVEAVHKSLGKETSKAQAERAVQAVIEGIKGGLKKNKPVQLVGFGTFKIVNRKARMGINPKTAEKIKIKASRSVKFSAGKDFKLKIGKT